MNDEKVVVVTGINGFVGEHLARHLKQEGCRVIGVGRDEKVFDKVAPFVDKYYTADLLDKSSLAAIDLSSANAIIHLAGLASVGDSFKHPDLYINGNADMTSNLLAAAKQQGFKGRAVIISTGAVYDAGQPSPLNESASVGGSSPYAEGKVRAERIAREFKNGGMDIVIARPFNHIGPGQNEGFLVPDMYKQLVEAKAQGESSITTGDLTTRRDYTDVRDIVRAYTLLALAPKLNHDTYNVSTGKSLSGEDILKSLETASGITDLEHVVDPSRLRPNDPRDITGNSSRLQFELRWKPEIPLKKTIGDFVADRQDSKLAA